MKKQLTLAAILNLAWFAAPASASGIFRGPWDLSYGAYQGAPGYSYNVAYSYGLPFGSANLYDPYDPFQNPGRGAYYPRTSYYPIPPYGLEPYTGPRLFGRRHETAPAAAPVVPQLEPIPSAPAAGGAVIDVSLPPNAEVWFDGEKTAQTGTERAFHSPPLRAGTSYLYLVRARWTEAGQTREQIQSIAVRSGERVRVAFPQQAAE